MTDEVFKTSLVLGLAFPQRGITPETTVWYFYPDIYTSIYPFKKCTGFEGASAFSLQFSLLSLALLSPISPYFKGILRLFFIFSVDTTYNKEINDC